MSEPPAAGARLIVDAMNVIGTKPDGWWRDRPAAWRRLAAQLERHAERTGDEILVVIDGRRPSDWEHGDAIKSVFAPGGPDAADDEIVARVKADGDPGSLRVVTSDRGLAERVRELGAEVVAAKAFRSELDDR